MTNSIVQVIIPFISAIIGGVISFLLFILTPNSKMKYKRNEAFFNSMDWTCGTLLECITNPQIIYDSPNLLRDIQNNIYLYGTKNELFVMSKVKQYISKIKENKQDINSYYVLAGFTLLLNVIRRETYKKPIISDYVYEMSFNDYSKIKNDLNSIHNELVAEFRLNKKYLIK